jgi:hypothetical protein
MENNYFVLRYQWMCKHMSGNEFLSSKYFNLEEFAEKVKKKIVYFNESYWWLNLLRGLP